MIARGWATVLLTGFTFIFLTSLIVSPLISTAIGQDGNNGADQYDTDQDKDNDSEQSEDENGDSDSNECPGAQEVATIGPTTADQRQEFTTTGEGFLVSYDVEFAEDGYNSLDVDITDEFGLVEFDTQYESGSYSYFVPEEAGTYEVETDLTPNRGAEYTVTVEDCTGDDSDQSTSPGDDDSDANGGVSGGEAAEDNDADLEDDIPSDIPSDIDSSTIPDKNLPNTGGVPLLGLALLGGGGVAAVGGLVSTMFKRNRG